MSINHKINPKLRHFTAADEAEAMMIMTSLKAVNRFTDALALIPEQHFDRMMFVFGYNSITIREHHKGDPSKQNDGKSFLSVPEGAKCSSADALEMFTNSEGAVVRLAIQHLVALNHFTDFCSVFDSALQFASEITKFCDQKNAKCTAA